ncbi:MAG: outer membrane protein assembly factor BamD [Alphaproteobacteria bacterium]|nr:outer membrane protein assembly factor BamD [Alphaproteobacteria bacterium]
MFSLIKRFIFIALLIILTGCSSSDEDTYVEKPAEDIYTEAYQAFNSQKYGQAANLFDEVERQHPYSTWAIQGQIMSAYAHYQAQQYDDAINTLDRFINLHPGHRYAAYAYYLKALCYYDQIVDIGRDQKNTQLAQAALTELINRFPRTSYAKDATLKLDLVRDHLAGKEMEIGRYYLKRKQYLAAINRFRQVIQTYQTTTHVPEALHRLTECYLALGINEEAQDSAAVLGHNFPGSDWYEDSFKLLANLNLIPKNKPNSWLNQFF